MVSRLDWRLQVDHQNANAYNILPQEDLGVSCENVPWKSSASLELMIHISILSPSPHSTTQLRQHPKKQKLPKIGEMGQSSGDALTLQSLSEPRRQDRRISAATAPRPEPIRQVRRTLVSVRGFALFLRLLVKPVLCWVYTTLPAMGTL